MNLESSTTALQSLRKREFKSSDIVEFFDEYFQNSKCYNWDTLSTNLDKCLRINRWEYLAFWLLIIRDEVLKYFDIVNNEQMYRYVTLHIPSLLDNQEPRVRTLVAEVIGDLAKIKDVSIYHDLGHTLLDGIKRTFHRVETTRPVVLGYETQVELDDTTGWKSLETYFCAYIYLVQGCGKPLLSNPNLVTDQEYELLVTNASTHINRHIRQVSLNFIDVIVTSLRGSEASQSNSVPWDDKILSRCCQAIALGLQDNWTQVRFAATVACRTLLQALSEQDRQYAWPKLLPRLCLNRHYVAEGVRVHSQETWRLIMGQTGRGLLAQYIEPVCYYYTQSTKAANHMIAEAACQAIAELATKVDRAAVLPYIPALLSALVACSAEESWPIRDAACVATGQVLRIFPNESRDVSEELFGRWQMNLTDSIWSVRENSAAAFGEVLRSEDATLRDEAARRTVDLLSANLSRANEELTLEQRRAQQIQFIPPAVLVELTSRQAGASLTDLPRVARADWGCCLDCVVLRAASAWEVSAGAVCLLTQLAQVFPDLTKQFLPRLWALLSLSHFKESPKLRSVVLQQLPLILTAIGKLAVKQGIEEYSHILFRILDPMCDEYPDAETCIKSLAAFIGPSILLSRVPEDMRHRFQAVLAAEVGAGGGVLGDEASMFVRKSVGGSLTSKLHLYPLPPPPDAPVT